MNRKRVTVMCAGAVGWALAGPVLAGQLLPTGVIFDMDTHTEFCDPDFWSFFGFPTVDFGSNGADSEDGSAVFTMGDWDFCDAVYGVNACNFLGAKHGDGRLCCGQPLCGGLGSGVRDADHNLTQGTGVTFRALLLLPDGGQPGIRAQFQLVDSNGLPTKDTDTVAVVPQGVPGKPWIDRVPPLVGDEQWHTYTVWFEGLDSSFSAAAIAGTSPLDYTDISGYKIIFRRGETTAGKNKVVFDEITLIDGPPQLWADHDSDGDVDLADYAELQRCYGQDPTVNTACARWDANFDTVVDENPGSPDANDVINADDLLNFQECFEGPGATGGFFPWCY